jgi:hypothetical protein
MANGFNPSLTISFTYMHRIGMKKSEHHDMFTGRLAASLENERAYQQNFQSGSMALYFAQCHDQNEIWLPLLEKVHAKIHGDYAALDGGRTG